MTIHFNSPSYLTNSAVNAAPLLRGSHESLSEFRQESEKSPHRDFTSAWDHLYQFFIDNQFVNKNGKWLIDNSPLPPLSAEQNNRLSDLFHKPYKISLKLRHGQTLEANISLNEIISHLGYDCVDLIGSGVHWVLGEDYFRRFLIGLHVPDHLIVDDLFDEMQTFPQDFDFRFYAPDADENSMGDVTKPLFRRLAQVLTKNSSLSDKSYLGIKDACPKKWFSKKEHVDKYGMATISFCHLDHSPQAGHVAFDVDLSFVKSLQRPYLTKYSACALKLDLKGKLPAQLSSSLESVQEALFHRLTRLIDAGERKTINKMGLPLILAATTKGLFPLKEDFLKKLDTQLKKNHFANDLFQDLVKVTDTHCKQSQALLAAAFNAASLVHKDKWLLALKPPSSKRFAGDSLLETIYRLTKTGVADISIVQHLLCICTYVGWGEKVTLYHKAHRNFFELQYREISSGHRPVSLFVKNDLAHALGELIKTQSWDLINALFPQWLEKASIDGPLLPENAIDSIQPLFSVEAPSARKLAFFLLLKLYCQNRVNGVEKLLHAFSNLLKDFTHQELVHCTSQLNLALETQGRGSRHITLLLQASLTWLSQQPNCDSLRLAEKIFKTQDSYLCRLALSLLHQDPLCQEAAALSLALIESCLEKRPNDAIDLFFQFASPAHLETHFLFFKILEKAAACKREIVWNLASLRKFTSKLKDHFPDDIEPAFIQKLYKVLESIDPLAAQAIASHPRLLPLLQGTPLEELVRLKNFVLADKNFANSHGALLNALKQPHDRHSQQLLREIVKLFLTKLQSVKPKERQSVVSMLLKADIKILYAECPSELASLYNRVFPFLSSLPTDRRAQICCEMAKAISLAAEACFMGEEISQIVSYLQTLKDPKKALTADEKICLQESITKIIPPLHQSHADILLGDLLCQCQRLGMKVQGSAAIGNAILDATVDSFVPQDSSALARAESIYSTVGDWLPGGELQQRLDRDAAVFVDACLSAKLPSRALLWAERISSAHQSHQNLLLHLQAANLWTLHAELLSYEKGRLFTSQGLSDGWLAQAAAEQKTAVAASIYLDKRSLINSSSIDSILRERLQLLAQALTNSKSALERELALDLLQAYELSSISLWDNALQAINLNSPEAHKKAWNAFVTFHINQASHATCMKLMEAFGSSGYADPRLLKYLDEGELHRSFFHRENPQERRNIQRCLCTNAIACVKAGLASDMDFHALNELRCKYAPKFPIGKYLQAWLQSHFPPHTQILNYLEEQEATGASIELPFSKELFNLLFTVLLRPFTLNLYQCALRLLTKAESADLANQGTGLKVVGEIIGLSLQKGRESMNPLLVKKAIDCFSVHKSWLLKEAEVEGTLYALVIENLPLILSPCKKIKNKTLLFKSLHKELILDLKLSVDPSWPQSVAARCATAKKWSSTHRLLTNLLRVPIKGEQVAPTLCFIQESLDWLIKHYSIPTDKVSTSSAREKCLKLLKGFIYSNLFFSKEISTDIKLHSAHLAATQLLIDSAEKYGLLIEHPHTSLEFTAFMSCCFSKDDSAHTSEERGFAAIRVTKRLLKNLTPAKFQRAVFLFSQTFSDIISCPIMGIPCLKAMILCCETQQAPVDVKLDQLSILDPLLATLLKFDYDQEAFCKETANAGEDKASIYLLHTYLDTLFKCLQELKKPTEEITAPFYAAASNLTFLVNYRFLPQSPIAYSLYHKLLDITLFHWNQLNDQNRLHQEIITLIEALVPPSLSGSSMPDKTLEDTFCKALLSMCNLISPHSGERGMYLFAEVFIRLNDREAFAHSLFLYRECVERLRELANMPYCNSQLRETLMRPEEGHSDRIAALKEWTAAYESTQLVVLP